MPKDYLGPFALVFAASLSGCGESYPTEARRYSEVVQDVLIAESICLNVQDCTRKQVVFWEGGNPWLPGYNMAFVSLYETKDAALVDTVVARLKQVKSENAMPAVKLTAYSSPHAQSKVTFREVTIR
jgi:hypothetical protein